MNKFNIGDNVLALDNKRIDWLWDCIVTEIYITDGVVYYDVIKNAISNKYTDRFEESQILGFSDESLRLIFKRRSSYLEELFLNEKNSSLEKVLIIRNEEFKRAINSEED